MKKRLALILTATLAVNTVAVSALSVMVDGKQLQGADPKIISSRTFVPVAKIADATGATVDWESSTKTVTINKNTTKLAIKIGSTTATKNNAAVVLDAPAQIINSKTYVPLSFIATSLDIPVSYNSASKTVYIGSTTDKTTYKVLRVVDGDTIEIDYKGAKTKVRLLGVDTPESVHPDASKNVAFGKIATEFTKNKVDGKNITLEFDVSQTDKYGRILAYVWVDGVMLNKELVSAGMAQAKTYPPDVKYSKDFAALQEKARNAKVGMWANFDEIFNKPPTTDENNNNSTAIDANKDGTWIKGNKNSLIYHKPGNQSYNKISAHNIVWFETAKDAEAAGYRAANN